MNKWCSIVWCPWKAKHYFTGGYKECWFHYGEFPLINWYWNLWTYLPRSFFGYIKYAVCLGYHGLSWGIDIKAWLLPWKYLEDF